MSCHPLQQEHRSHEETPLSSGPALCPQHQHVMDAWWMFIVQLDEWMNENFVEQMHL